MRWPLFVLAALLLTALPAEALLPPRVTMTGPTTVVVGELVRVGGSVTTLGVGTSATVRILDGDVHIATVKTAVNGAWTASFKLPRGVYILVAEATTVTGDPGRSQGIIVDVIAPPSAPGLEATQDPYHWRTVTVRWSAPADDGGSAVTAYEVRRDGATLDPSYFTWHRYETVAPGETTTWTARAKNAAGWSPWTSVTFTAPPPPPADRLTSAVELVWVCGQDCRWYPQTAGYVLVPGPLVLAKVRLAGGLMALGEGLAGKTATVHLESVSTGPCTSGTRPSDWTCAPGGVVDVRDLTVTSGADGIMWHDVEIAMGDVPPGERRIWTFTTHAESEGFVHDAVYTVAVWSDEGGGDPPCSDGCSGGSD